MYSPRTVLVPTDLSDEDRSVLARAADLARRTGARVHLLHVFDSLLHDLPLDGVESESTRALRVRMRGVAHDTLEKLAAAFERDGVRVTTEQRLAPEAAPSIVACAHDIAADRIVMGTHGRSGLQRLLRGSVAEVVAARAPCPVEVVRRLSERDERRLHSLEGVRERIRMAWM